MMGVSSQIHHHEMEIPGEGKERQVQDIMPLLMQETKKQLCLIG